MAFKVGDKVKLLNGGNEYPLHGFVNGEIYKVIGVTSSAFGGDKRKRITIINDSAMKGHALPQDLKLVEPKLTKNQRISSLEKELAHTKECFETLRKDYFHDIELLQERFQKKIKALEMVLADKSKLRQSDEPTQQDVQRKTVCCPSANIHGEHLSAAWFEETTEKTPNQQRAELIEKAKDFVEEEGTMNIELVVNEEYRSATAIWYKSTDVVASAVKCEPDKVFNADIFKAIALGRVLGRNVKDFENAVQPTVAIGQVVTFKGSSTLQVVTRRNPHFTDAWFKDNDVWSYGHELTILDDTNAIYTEEAQ